ncbi:helix-turn-helix transcriptional regulator [Paenarthrobacter sp. NPDC090520]|uniref:helix-turn-helix transcriptional regulator n=1 Tax=Paenarthrobacter sp. NPDC090520 TaxID=3364382 RepID=UPI0038074019
MEHSQETDFFRAFDAKSFGAALRSARKERELTQQELGAIIRASRHTIVRLERGENVALETAIAAARALERDIALIPRFSRLDVKR